jgi:predicted Zn finger-like uncharacterized protein
MKITCQSCQAKYTIADEKVAGKTVKIKCKKCGATIVVSGADAGAAPAAAAPQPQAYGAQAPGPMMSAPPGDDDEGEGATRVFSEGGPGGPAADEWTVNVTDEDQRTLSGSQILMEFQRGVVTTDTYVWKDGMADWLPICDIPELMRLVSSPRPAAGGGVRPAAGGAPRPAAGMSAPAPAAASPAMHMPSAVSAPAAAARPAPAPVMPDLDPGGLGGTMIMNEGSPLANPMLHQEPSAAAFAAAAPVAARRGGKPAAVDLFASGQHENAKNAAAQHVADSHADRQVGERNENSVLFSISALTAAAGAGKKGDDPFDLGAPAPKNNGRGAVDDFMNLNSGIGGAMLAPPPLLTPFVEPPPPPPPQPVAPVASAAPAMSAVPAMQMQMQQAAPPPKSKAPLIVALFAVVAIAGGAGAFFALKPAAAPGPSGTESTTKATAATTAAEAPTAAPTPTQTAAAPVDTGKPAETSAAQAATAPTGTPTAAVAAGTPKGGPAPGGPLPGKAPDAKPDKAPDPPKADKTPDPPKADKTPDPPKADAKPDTGGAGGKEFDRAAAMSALGGASGAARGCKKDDGPTGTARVKITFAPNGSVTSASVDGPPFAGTAVGGCIAGAFRGAHVPAFDGGPVTVTKSVSIN